MGGMMGFLDKLPGMSNSGIQDAIAQANPEKQVKKMEAIIQSMTIKERRNPDLMNPSRKSVLQQVVVWKYQKSTS